MIIHTPHKRDAGPPHSPEPWTGLPHTRIHAGGRCIILMNTLSPKQDADYRRTLACVNACTGIDTPILESLPPGTIAEGMSAFTTLQAALKDVQTNQIGDMHLIAARARLSRINDIARLARSQTTHFE